MNTLRQYALPLIGDMPVNEIDSPHVLRVLSPIWLSKPETARRVRQRIGTVLSWAKAAGYRTGDNPVEGVAKGLPKQRDRNEHHPAMPFAEVPTFIARLRGDSEQGEFTRLALEFLILTATRTGEVLGAKWQEFDEHGQVWTIPDYRMKAARAHRVPLSSRCLEILKRAKLLSAGSQFIFPGRTITRPMSNMVFLMTLRRMGVPFTASAFGLRSGTGLPNAPTTREKYVKWLSPIQLATRWRRLIVGATCSTGVGRSWKSGQAI